MTHPEIEKLLPWYVNGTLGEGERRAVADHLCECAQCTGELRALEELQVAVRDAAQRAPEPSPFLLTRALASIDAYEREKAGVRWPWLAWWTSIPRLARIALVVQLAGIIALGSYLVTSRDRRPYVTAASGSQAGRARIAVMFQPGASESQIREALHAVGASIVGGPSALGLYTIELPVGGSDSEGVARALKVLRDRREVVRFAELAQ